MTEIPDASTAHGTPSPLSVHAVCDRFVAQYAELDPVGAVGLDRLAHDAEAMPAEHWDMLVSALAGWQHPAWYVLNRCPRELETHHLDLAVGYCTDDWSTEYVTWALEDTLSTLAARDFPLARVEAVDLGLSWAVSGTGPVVSGAGHSVLGVETGLAQRAT